MFKLTRGFKDFVSEQAVVGLAVGLVIGTSVKSVVDSFVADFVNPILGVILGGVDLSKRTICISHSESGVCINKIAWGNFVLVLIQFLIILAIIYFVVKGLGLDKLDRKKEKEEKEEENKEHVKKTNR